MSQRPEFAVLVCGYFLLLLFVCSFLTYRQLSLIKYCRETKAKNECANHNTFVRTPSISVI